MLLTITLEQASRLQFAITAMFHWIFVPLTLGLGFLVALFETKYYLSKSEFWKKTTQFWSRIFAINFACGVATGIILEFEFGTNWSNYSWFVGDIFGAPLAIEGIFAFFMETTFFAVMYFGWGKVSKGFHLASTWLTAIGATLSAYWILAANSWMQYPTGVVFNPDTARNEMVDFWGIVFSPVTLSKFSHSVLCGFLLAAIVVIGICAWYLLKKRDTEFSVKCMKIAALFGLVSAVLLAVSGDNSAYMVAKTQPMKLAAMEGLYDGQKGAPLVGVGILNPKKSYDNDESSYIFHISLPKALSFLATRSADGFVPGISDIIRGGYEYTGPDGKTRTALSFEEMKNRGDAARQAYALYGEYKDKSDNGLECEDIINGAREQLEANFEHFGYGFLDSPEEIIPPVGLVFYSFRIMVILGGYFIFFLILVLWFARKNILPKYKWFLMLAIASVPLVYICGEAGWIVAEVGRQPWTIQSLLPIKASVSGVSSSNVVATVIIFVTLFTTLLVAELMIAFNQIKKGPEGIEW